MRQKRRKQSIYNLLTIAAVCVMVVAGFLVVRSFRGTETAANSDRNEEAAPEGQVLGGREGTEDADTGEVRISVVDQRGIAYVIRKGIGFEIETGDEVRAGDRLETETDAELMLHGETANWALNENSRLEIGEKDAKRSMKLLAGELFTEAFYATSGTVELKSCRILADTEQTVYDLSLQEGSIRILVLAGTVRVADWGEDEIVVAAGECCDLYETDGNSEFHDLKPEELDAYAIAQAVRAAENGAVLVYTEKELQSVIDSREKARAAEAEALAAHEAQIIAGGVSESDGTAGSSADSKGGSAGENGSTGAGSSAGTAKEQAKQIVTISIRCDSILSHMDKLAAGKNVYVPANGTILATCQVAFSEGETVFDILRRTCSYTGVPLEYSYSGTYGSYYIEGINNLYEFDCGNLSGWTYTVNGWSPNYGCSSCKVKAGDSIVWSYVCN